jgi:hypothetical protein
MRRLLALAVICLLQSAPAIGRMIGAKDPSEGGRLWPGKEQGIAGYRVTRTRGEVIEVVKVSEKKPWYYFTHATGKMSSQLMVSVSKIEPILQADLDKKAAVDRELHAEAVKQEKERREEEEKIRLEEFRLAAREEARTKARTEARTEPAAAGYSTSSSGRTNYTGPRGGVYHYSASGKKVYSKKK